MDFRGHRTTWQGMPVSAWTPGDPSPLTGGILYRLEITRSGKEILLDVLAAFLAQPGVSEVSGIVLGLWSGDTEGLDAIVEVIAAAREKLASLTTLFIGDIAYDEWEISWIRQSDLSPLLNAYPLLEHFGVRGAQGLSLGIPRLHHLKSLTIECGGLPVSVIREICVAELPSLEHLEIYLGDTNYGANHEMTDLQTIIDDGPAKWPRLTYLGLRDCEYTDAIAAALTEGDALLLRQLQTLDLSLGTIGDAGVQALAGSPAIAGLRQIDIHHHFASEESVALLMARGIPVDTSEAEEEEEDDDERYRYVAVGE